MEVFRISHNKYSHSLTASGRANRWNADGQHVIYTASSRSLATLELLVHMNHIKPESNYQVMVISLHESDHLIRQIKISELPKNWRKMTAYALLQNIGSTWYQSMESLLLKVPSVVVPFEYNYVINVNHPDFRKTVQLVRHEDYFWDNRLL